MNLDLSRVTNCLGYRTITVSTAVKALSDGTDPSDGTAVAVPVGARCCAILVASNPVNFRDDGTAPTSSVGFPLVANDTLENQRVSSNLKFIRSGGSDATLHILYFA